MGFFSRIKETISDAVETVKDKVCEVKWWLEDMFDEIFGDPGYLDEDSSAQDTAKVQNRLTEMRDRNKDNIAKQTKIFEDALSENFYNIIENMNRNGKMLERYHIDLSSYESDIAGIVNNMSQKIEELFTKRLSLDDDECVEILKIIDDSQRRNKQIQFARKVLQEGKQQLLKEFKRSSDILFDRLQKTIGNALDDNEIQLTESSNKLNELYKGDKDKADKVVITAQVGYGACKAARMYLSD